MKAEVRSCPATCPMLAIQPHCAQPCLTTMPAARFTSSRASPPPPSACAAHVPLLCESSAQKCTFLRHRWAVAMAIISTYVEEVEKALETVGGEAGAAARGWSLGPPRAAVTLPRGEGRAGW